MLERVVTPSDPGDGARLAEEVLAGVQGIDGGRGEDDFETLPPSRRK